MFRYGKWRLRKELYLTRVRGKYRDLLQAPPGVGPGVSLRRLPIELWPVHSTSSVQDVKWVWPMQWAWPSGRGRGDVMASASSGDACGGAAFNKVLLPLWLCIVFTAYMFGPASLGLCCPFHTAAKSGPVPGQFGARARALVSHRQRTGSGP